MTCTRESCLEFKAREDKYGWGFVYTTALTHFSKRSQTLLVLPWVWLNLMTDFRRDRVMLADPPDSSSWKSWEEKGSEGWGVVRGEE